MRVFGLWEVTPDKSATHESPLEASGCRMNWLLAVKKGELL
jgi:hypothetical protein